MRKIILITIMLIISVPEFCFAMHFYQSERLGTFYFNQIGHGFMMKGETINIGDKYTKIRGNNSRGYGKGIATFGYGKDALYVAYNAYTGNLDANFGNKQMTSYVPINDMTFKTIYCIKSDSGMTLYPIVRGHSYVDLTIIGKRQDGTFVKYIESERITSSYFGMRTFPNYEYDKVRIFGDTIIVPYCINKDIKIRGEFRFKWNEKAQWFGVEKVDY